MARSSQVRQRMTLMRERTLAETSGGGGNVILLTQADAEAFTEFALQLWTDATGVTPTIPIEVTVADLPGNQLGSTTGNTIVLDVDAAGIGWFIDATPGDNVAFQRYDLLTAVAHEVGHALGYEHSNAGVMADTLAVGERRLPVLNTAPTEPVFIIETQASTINADDTADESPILTQPVYTKASRRASAPGVIQSDSVNSNGSQIPLAILPDDESDSLFTELNGSLLEELLTV